MNVNERRDAAFEAMLYVAFKENHAKEMSILPVKEEVAKEYNFSEKHKKRMKTLFRNRRRKEIILSCYSASKRVTASIIIIVTVIFGILLTDENVRASVTQTIISKFEQFTRFLFEGTTTLEEIYNWYPFFIPYEFEPTVNMQLGDMVILEFENQYGHKILLDYGRADATQFSTDNEYTNYFTVNENGLEFHVFESFEDSGRRNSITWYDRGYIFLLESKLSIETMMQIALSVAPKPDV